MNHLLYVIAVQLHAFLPPLPPALEPGAEKVCAAAADPAPHHSLQLMVVFIPMAMQMVFQWSKEREVARRQVWAVWRLAHDRPTQPFDLLVGGAGRVRACVVLVEFAVAGIQCWSFLSSLSQCTLGHPLSAASRVLRWS